MSDPGRATRYGEGREGVGAGLGFGWGLKGSSMSSCRLVWLVGGALGPDFAPVGGVLANKAPPAQDSSGVKCVVFVGTISKLYQK